MCGIASVQLVSERLGPVTGAVATADQILTAIWWSENESTEYR